MQLTILREADGMFHVILDGRCTAGALSWDEMLGQLVSLTLPAKIGNTAAALYSQSVGYECGCTAAPKGSADVGPGPLAKPEDVIARLCRLSERVAAEVCGYDQPNDCFCRAGGVWRSPGSAASWRNSGETLCFIERVVDEAIARRKPGRLLVWWRHLAANMALMAARRGWLPKGVNVEDWR